MRLHCNPRFLSGDGGGGDDDLAGDGDGVFLGVRDLAGVDFLDVEDLVDDFLEDDDRRRVDALDVVCCCCC